VKKVEAYIRHEAFEPIRMELLSLGFPSLSISEVKGSGRQKGITERYRGAELTNYLRPKVKLECVVADRDVQTIVDTVLKHASAANPAIDDAHSDSGGRQATGKEIRPTQILVDPGLCSVGD